MLKHDGFEKYGFFMAPMMENFTAFELRKG